MIGDGEKCEGFLKVSTNKLLKNNYQSSWGN